MDQELQEGGGIKVFGIRKKRGKEGKIMCEREKEISEITTIVQHYVHFVISSVGEFDSRVKRRIYRVFYQNQVKA